MSVSQRERYPLSLEMQEFVRVNQGFAAADASLNARREAFLRGCRHFTPVKPQGLQVTDTALGNLPIRLYKPSGGAPKQAWPVLLYLHGGGWDLGHLDTHDWFVYALAKRLNLVIVAVAYRLAPEHPYPAALDDCLTVWNALRAGELGDDLSRQQLVVCGDSAGGTLAAGLCMTLRAKGESQPLGQALVYPVLTTETFQPSATLYADAPLLSTTGLEGSFERYLPVAQMRSEALAMPLMANNFRGLAPAFIGVAEFDILRDEGYAYRDALEADHVPVSLYLGKGLLHGSLRAQGVEPVEAFYDALAQSISTFLANANDSIKGTPNVTDLG
ncbi:alpha/beta hydrolase [Pseudomonas sp. Pseusp16]|uniref:alpha/beta hydrolase n=1 Tax=Pseudomonas sp. Pseusp16 TaxID=3243021 RepID=UPI0039B52B7A